VPKTLVIDFCNVIDLVSIARAEDKVGKGRGLLGDGGCCDTRAETEE
jgi:hypothetical protein